MNIPRRLLGWVLGKRLPKTAGELAVNGLHGRVSIRRDAWGVPYISAGGDHDAWLGLGFCHGQDRAGQLELLVRAVRGSLSEAIGRDGLPIDRLSRRIGFRRAAEAQLAAADEATQEQIDAYARGISQGMTRGLRRKPHELSLLRCPPTPWEAADVQGLLALLCFAIASNWDAELIRLEILTRDGPDALAQLDPTYPHWLPVSSPPFSAAGETLDRLAHDIEVFTRVIGSGGGSNAWAVGPGKTATGRPLLASDPHLNSAAPCQWYLARLETPDWRAAGATFVGIPAMGIGHNGFAAWGITAGQADNTDLFLEEIGDDHRSVRQGDRFVSCRVREERIRVRGAPDEIERVLETPRGPIIGPALANGHDALSISATWLAPRPYEGLLGVHKVRSFEDFRRVFEANSTSAISIVYADEDGHVGWQLAMSLPRRRKGHGTIPLPGWDPDVGWEPEPVPARELPAGLDPETGFVATANNQPVSNDANGPFLGVDWLDGYRQAAIVEALAARDDWDVASSQTLQTDTRSLAWEEIRDVVLGLRPADPDAARAVETLTTWDGSVRADSVGATVFELFVVEMCQRVVRAKAPNAAAWALGQTFTGLIPSGLVITRRLGHLVGLIRESPPGYFASGWPGELAQALATVIGQLRARFGDDGDWTWGHVRPLRLIHAFGEHFPLNRIFNLGPYPGYGDSGTIAQGAVDFHDPMSNVVGLANFRMVVDVGAWDRSRFVLLGGQSGNPVSPHYDDQVPLWQRGDGIPIHWSEAVLKRAVRDTLTLLPG